MPSGNIIRVSEYEKLYYDEDTAFKQQHWEALCSYLHSIGRQHNKPVAYFQIINKGIRFTSYVGAIQVGNLTIEILPKVDTADTTAQTKNELRQADQQRWHTVLLQMLSECKWLTIHPVGWAQLSLQKQSILDVYLSAFLAEAEKLLHEGLLKQYARHEGNQPVLKGRLLFNKQVTKNSVHQEHFYVSSTAYEINNPFNRILYKAIGLVQQISSNPLLQQNAGSLLLQIPEMKSVAILNDTFKQLTYGRKTERYRPAMQLAEIIIHNTSPAISGGQVHTLALLFDMNALWEEWVYRQLKKEEKKFGITVQRQQSTAFWQSPHLSKPKTIRPDIVIRQGDKTIVADTKWKIIENGTPANDDLKQMFVYNLYWQCEHTVLLYPANKATDLIEGRYASIARISCATCRCLVLSQSVWDANSRLNADFGKEVLEKILV